MLPQIRLLRGHDRCYSWRVPWVDRLHGWHVLHVRLCRQRHSAGLRDRLHELRGGGACLSCRAMPLGCILRHVCRPVLLMVLLMADNCRCHGWVLPLHRLLTRNDAATVLLLLLLLLPMLMLPMLLLLLTLLRQVCCCGWSCSMHCGPL